MNNRKKSGFFVCHHSKADRKHIKKAPRREPANSNKPEKSQYSFLSLSEASRAISVFTGSLTLLMKIMAAMTYGL